MSSIADELLVESLPEETRKAINAVYDMKLENAMENYDTYDYDKGYEDGINEGRLDTALKEKRDLNRMLERIREALTLDDSNILIKKAIEDFENEIVA